MCWAIGEKDGPALFIYLFLWGWECVGEVNGVDITEGERGRWHTGEVNWVWERREDESSLCLGVIVIGVEGNDQVKVERSL